MRVNKEEVYNALCALPDSYAIIIPNEILPYFIRNVVIAISHPLEHIFNAAYTDTIPKYAPVSSIANKPPYRLASNYRPSSTLPEC